MEDIPVIVPQVPPEPVYAKALINGFGATIILWTFWMPFIIGFARPLVNAQIKGFVCEIEHLAVRSSDNSNWLFNYLMALVASNVITYQQMEEILANQNGPPIDNTVALNVIQQNPQKNIDENTLIIILFVVTYFLVMICCAIGIYSLSSWFSIDLGPLYKFNAVMALIIIAIEAIFFGVVAMSYIPFDINLIIEQLQFKLDSYLSNIGSQQLIDPNLPPIQPIPKPACQFQAAPLQDYFIGGWIQPTTSFGTLDEAKQRCILNSQCVGVTQPANYLGSYILTSTRNKYVEPPGSGYHNKGSTSWLLNECR
jgi:hypothetical protein